MMELFHDWARRCRNIQREVSAFEGEICIADRCIMAGLMGCIETSYLLIEEKRL